MVTCPCRDEIKLAIFKGGQTKEEQNASHSLN